MLPVINILGTALKRGANGIGGQHGSLDVGHERRHLLSEDQRRGGTAVKKEWLQQRVQLLNSPVMGMNSERADAPSETRVHTALPFRGLLWRVVVQEGDGG